MKNVIVERRLLYSSKGSKERKELIIRVGAPFWDNDGMAACPIEMDGLFDVYGPIKGIDLLHALKLVADVDPLLDKLRNKYEFFWPDGQPYHDEIDSAK